MEGRNNAIKKTGELLITGWKMLSISCPICQTALMSKKEEIQCPSCNLPVKMEKSEPTNQPKEQISFEELKREYDFKNKSRDIISNALGDKMLQGWTLLGDICQNQNCNGTPLMKSASGQIICVCCQQNIQLENSQDKVSLNDLNKDSIDIDESDNDSEDLSFLDHSTFLEQEKKHENSSSYPSRLISEKLLQGWALLDQVCQSNCQGKTPLMRNKDGKVECVVCNSELKKCAPAPVLSSPEIPHQTISTLSELETTLLNKISEASLCLQNTSLLNPQGRATSRDLADTIRSFMSTLNDLGKLKEEFK